MRRCPFSIAISIRQVMIHYWWERILSPTISDAAGNMKYFSNGLMELFPILEGSAAVHQPPLDVP
jgi:hypothetical protein